MNVNKHVLLLLICLFFGKTYTEIEKGKLAQMKAFYKDLPVLVTGGAGFIGSQVTKTLVQLGANVTVMDNLSTGNIKNLDNVISNITFIEKSITNFDACLEATKDKAIIFHLAAFISVPESLKNPALCHKTNIDGTFNLLEASRINNVKKFIFSSSAAVYGPATAICKEDMPCNPQSPYGTSKLVGELFCKQYADNFALGTIVLRYFNVFGDRQNPNGAYAAVVAKFMYQMKHNLPITIFGDGLQTRDFIPVEKVAEANLTVAMLDQLLMNGQIFNIATGKSINLFELIDTLKAKFPDYTGKILFGPSRPGDIKNSSADCEKYNSLSV